MRIVSVSLVLLILVFSGLVISSKMRSSRDGDVGDLKIATTIFPSADIAKNVAGEGVEVVQILPVGVSPHTYEPKVSDKLKLRGVAKVFVIGFGLDDFALSLVDDASGDKVVPLGKYVELKRMGDKPDPHYFTSVGGAIAMSKVYEEELSGLDTANASRYESNAESYRRSLQELLSSSKEKISRLGHKPRIVTFHNAFSYFADELGIDIVATVEPFPGKEPTIEYLANLKRVVTETGADAIFAEPQLSRQASESLSADLGLPVYTLDPLGGYDGRGSFIANYEKNVDAIVSAVQEHD